jgi:hypothetical protein
MVAQKPMLHLSGCQLHKQYKEQYSENHGCQTLGTAHEGNLTPCINMGLNDTTSCLSSHIGKYVDFFDLLEKIPKVECKH